MISNKSTITACQININGLSSHCLLALDKYIDEHEIDILALQETGFMGNGTVKFTNRITLGNSQHDSCSGVLLSIKRHLNPTLIQELMSEDVDCVWASINIDNKQILVGSVYTKPERATTTGGTSLLNKLLENIVKAKTWTETNKHTGLLIYGDYNARSINWGDIKCNRNGKSLSDFVLKEDMVICTPSERTFVCTSNAGLCEGGSIIDLVIAKGKIIEQIGEQWIDSESELFTGAPIRGHYPVFQNIHINPAHYRKEKSTKSVTDLDNTDWEEWASVLEEELYHLYRERDSQTDSNKMWADMLNAVNKTNERALCMKIISRHSKPYWSPILSVLSKNVQQARKIMKARFTPVNKEKLRYAAETFKKKLIEEKNKWVHKRAESLNISNSREFWKRYKKVFGCPAERGICNLKSDGKLATNNKDKEEMLFETFFEGKHLQGQHFDTTHQDLICAELTSIKQANWNIDTVQQNNMQTYQERLAGSSRDQEGDDYMDEVVTIQDVKAAIKEQKTGGKSPDSDNIHPRMLRHMPSIAIEVLCKLINLALETGVWPWARSRVTFLRKDGKPNYNIPGAYRPISISSYIGKVAERIIEKRLRKFCNNNHILD